MRMMLKITIPADAGSRAIKDGTLGKIIEATMAKVKPEASYFATNNGMRCAMLFFDMKDTSDIPAIAEPLFAAFDAQIEFFPVMNGADLQKGLAAAMHAM